MRVPLAAFLRAAVLKPSNILSLCWNGDLKKTGPTRFESVLRNVQPMRDIKMVVLENPPPAP